MAITFSSGQLPATASKEDSSTTDTGNSVSISIFPTQCVIVVVTRAGNFAIGTVTDNGAGGGNVYTQQVLYNSSLPNIAIFTSIATKYASSVTVNWTAGSASAISIVLENGVGSIGINSGFTTGVGTSESITCTLASPNNWAVVGISHGFAGGVPTSTSGNKRVTSTGASGNDYTSIIDNTGATSVTCSNSYGTSTSFSAVYVELIPASVAVVQFSSFNGAVVDNGSSVTDAVVNPLGNATVPGNLLICLCMARCSSPSSGGTKTLSISTPITSGITWVLAKFINNSGIVGSLAYGSAVAIFIAAGAPSMPHASTTDVTFSANATVTNLTGDVYIQEVCGLSGAIDISGSGIGGYPSVSANVGTLTLNTTDFLIELAITGDGSVYALGSGYEVYPGNPLSGGEFEVGNTQFIPLQAAGSIGTSFGASNDGSNGSPYWSCIAVAFIAGIAPVTQPVVWISS